MSFLPAQICLSLLRNFTLVTVFPLELKKFYFQLCIFVLLYGYVCMSPESMKARRGRWTHRAGVTGCCTAQGDSWEPKLDPLQE